MEECLDPIRGTVFLPVYEGLQLHVGPQLQESPHGQLIVLSAAFAFWQPHLHAAPAPDTHEHWFDLVDMINFLSIWLI
jgi:hypothetical protein